MTDEDWGGQGWVHALKRFQKILALFCAISEFAINTVNAYIVSANSCSRVICIDYDKLITTTQLYLYLSTQAFPLSRLFCWNQFIVKICCSLVCNSGLTTHESTGFRIAV